MQATLQQQLLSERSGIKSYVAQLNETSGNPITERISMDTLDAGFTFEKISSTEFRMTSSKDLPVKNTHAYIRPNKSQTAVCNITIQQDDKRNFTIFTDGEDSLINHTIKIDMYVQEPKHLVGQIYFHPTNPLVFESGQGNISGVTAEVFPVGSKIVRLSHPDFTSETNVQGTLRELYDNETTPVISSSEGFIDVCCYDANSLYKNFSMQILIKA